MLIVNKGSFGKGFVLLLSFLGVFLWIMSPSFGGGRTGLEFSDDFFNKLAKNSSNYFKEVEATAAKQKGKQLNLSVTLPLPDPKVQPDPVKAQEAADANAKAAAKALTTAGGQVDVKGNVLMVKGDLGAILEFATKNSVDVFNVVGDAASAPENLETRKMLNNLWKAFNAMLLPLQRDKLLDEAKAVNQVMRKAVEPAYNFYGISGEPVSQNALMLTALLIFYVIYTMWYGFAIFSMFEGIGMSMKKAKVKKEV